MDKQSFCELQNWMSFLKSLNFWIILIDMFLIMESLNLNIRNINGTKNMINLALLISLQNLYIINNKDYNKNKI